MRNKILGLRINRQFLRSPGIIAAVTDATTEIKSTSFNIARSFASQSSPQTRSPVSYQSLALTMATGAGIFFWYQQEKNKKLEALSSKSVVVGQAAIGGPFSLIDHRGKPFTDKDLLGTFSLLYFGFTHCPDICPEELEKVAEAVDLTTKNIGIHTTSKDENKKPLLVPVFISIDPERDHPKIVGEYAKEFHPDMIALTGTIESVKEAARAYRVYYTKAGLGEITRGDTNSAKDDDYLIDHSIITYLIDPEGKFVTFYGRNYTAEEMAKSLQGHIEGWKKKHPEWMS